VLFRPGLKPGAGPSQAQIGQAKLGRDNGFMVALAWPALLKAKAKPQSQGFLAGFVTSLCRYFLIFFNF
jgi:hypothetical protein